MKTGRSRGGAGALLAVLVAALLAPLAPLADASSSAPARHGCHCPVKMACCEAGLCHGGDADVPSAGPSWSGCRDEADGRGAAAPPFSAFDGGLLATGAGCFPDAGEPTSTVTAPRPRAFFPSPLSPPPRASIDVS